MSTTKFFTLLSLIIWMKFLAEFCSILGVYSVLLHLKTPTVPSLISSIFGQSCIPVRLPRIFYFLYLVPLLGKVLFLLIIYLGKVKDKYWNLIDHTNLSRRFALELIVMISGEINSSKSVIYSFSTGTYLGLPSFQNEKIKTLEIEQQRCPRDTEMKVSVVYRYDITAPLHSSLAWPFIWTNQDKESYNFELEKS